MFSEETTRKIPYVPDLSKIKSSFYHLFPYTTKLFPPVKAFLKKPLSAAGVLILTAIVKPLKMEQGNVFLDVPSFRILSGAECNTRVVSLAHVV